MKKLSIFIIAAAMALAAAGTAIASDTWSAGGAWDYTLSATGEFNNKPVTFTASGDLLLDSSTNHSTNIEHLDKYDLAYKIKLTCDGDEISHQNNKSGSLDFDYDTGKTYNSIITETINNKTLSVAFSLTQTGDDKATGTATVKYDGKTATGTIDATKSNEDDDDSSSGGCNAGLAGTLLLFAIPTMCGSFRRRK